MKLVNVNVDLMQVFVIISNVECKELQNNHKCRRECKELTDEGIWDKGFIWNLGSCEWECDKSCDVEEYLNYENCKCRKNLQQLINW